MSLYLFAMDQRGWLERAVAEVVPGSADDVATLVRQAKELSFAGLRQAIASGVEPGSAGVLVDEQYGSDIARRAKEEEIVLSVPMERADCDVLALEYGEAAMDHVRQLGPDLPKLLIRHNVGGDREGNALQLERLRVVDRMVHDAGLRLLLELLVPATAQQMASVGGSLDRYDRELRPSLTGSAVEEIRAAGVEVDMWKIEGMDDPEDARGVARACTEGTSATCLVLGRNAPWEGVERWLRNAAAAPGYGGFAIGRTLWWDAVVAWLQRRWDRDQAVSSIADAYRRAITVYEAAPSGDADGTPSRGPVG